MSNALRACCLLLTGVLLGIAAADFPAVPPIEDQANLGVGIQHTMTLLATSTASACGCCSTANR